MRRHRLLCMAGARAPAISASQAVQHAPWALDLLDAELQHDPVLAFHAVQARHSEGGGRRRFGTQVGF